MVLPLDFWASPGDVWVPMSTNLDLGSTRFPVLGTFLGLVVFLGLFLTPFTSARENILCLRGAIKRSGLIHTFSIYNYLTLLATINVFDF